MLPSWCRLGGRTGSTPSGNVIRPGRGQPAVHYVPTAAVSAIWTAPPLKEGGLTLETWCPAEVRDQTVASLTGLGTSVAYRQPC